MSTPHDSVSQSNQPPRDVNWPLPQEHDNDKAPCDIPGRENVAKPIDEALKSMGPFLGRLPRETRDTIYEYVLEFDKVPLRRTGEKTIPRTYFHWSFRQRRFVERRIPPIPATIVNTNIFTVNNIIHHEALAAMYEINTISLNLEKRKQILKKGNIVQLGVLTGDAAMTRHVLLRLGWPHARRRNHRWFRHHNTIHLDSFFAKLQSAFPRLRSVTVRTDHALHATTALFDIGQDLTDCNQVKSVNFDAVGSLVAETNLGFTVRIEHYRIIREWQQQLAQPLVGYKEYVHIRAVLYCRIRRLLEAEKLHKPMDHQCRTDLERYTRFIDHDWESFASDVPETYKACSYESDEFWTYAVGKYVAFKTCPSDYSFDADDGDDVDDDFEEDDFSDESENSDVATIIVGFRD